MDNADPRLCISCFSHVENASSYLKPSKLLKMEESNISKEDTRRKLNATITFFKRKIMHLNLY